MFLTGYGTSSAARAALTRGLLVTRPGIELSAAGYVSDIEENLLPGIARRHFEADLLQGDGDELRSKFKAAHSSSALAVNCFARFKDVPGGLALNGHSGFAIRFEAKCPTGLLRGRAPNLDVLGETASYVVGIESKCTEYLSAKRGSVNPLFKEAYFQEIRDERRDGPWFHTMKDISFGTQTFAHLDAAQLVKHAFGLAHCFKDRITSLLYLYWEPTDAEEYSVFAEHREEILCFGKMVSGGFPAFLAMSYAELWSFWLQSECPPWLHSHIVNLRSRYAVPLRP